MQFDELLNYGNLLHSLHITVYLYKRQLTFPMKKCRVRMLRIRHVGRGQGQVATNLESNTHYTCYSCVTLIQSFLYLIMVSSISERVSCQEVRFQIDFLSKTNFYSSCLCSMQISVLIVAIVLRMSTCAHSIATTHTHTHTQSVWIHT